MMPYFMSESITNGLVDLGLKITSFTFGPLIGLFLLARMQKKISFASFDLVFSLFATIVSTILLTYLLAPALGLIIPIGFILFNTYIGLFELKRIVFQRRV